MDNTGKKLTISEFIKSDRDYDGNLPINTVGSSEINDSSGYYTENDRNGAFLEIFRLFCDGIIKNGYKSIPSLSEFRFWLEKQCRSSVPGRIIYLFVKRYAAANRKQIGDLQADVIAAGAAFGFYDKSISTFILKNWSGWADRSDNTTTTFGQQNHFNITIKTV